MSIDEAIEHAREVAEKERKSKCNTYDINDCYKCEKYKEISTSKRMTEIICPCGNKTFEYIPNGNKNVRVDKNDCLQCAEEHEQLAEWLEELKELKKKWLESDAYNEGLKDCRADVEEEVENRFNRVLDDEKRLSYEQGKADMLKEIEQAMYHQCFEVDNPEDMQKWDGGNWFRYKLFENVLEQIKEKNNE